MGKRSPDSDSVSVGVSDSDSDSDSGAKNDSESDSESGSDSWSRLGRLGIDKQGIASTFHSSVFKLGTFPIFLRFLETNTYMS